jgi:hypothetical protein
LAREWAPSCGRHEAEKIVQCARSVGIFARKFVQQVISRGVNCLVRHPKNSRRTRRVIESKGLRETHLEISTGDRAVVLTTFSMAAAWMLGFKLTESANLLVSKAAGFEALDVNIAAPGHTIAGWWIDDGHDSPVILLLHAVRADRSTMVTRAQLLRRHGFSVLLIDLQGHGETPGTGAKASAG